MILTGRHVQQSLIDVIIPKEAGLRPAPTLDKHNFKYVYRESAGE
jgi:hypothetical protein